MENILYAAAALGFIFLMTTLGAACVFFTGKCGNYRGLNGFSAGVMIAASFWSLLLPAIELSEKLVQPEWLVLSSGVAVGSFFIAFPDLIAKKEKGESRVFRAVTLHNVPEGLYSVRFGRRIRCGGFGRRSCDRASESARRSCDGFAFRQGKRAQKSLSSGNGERGGRARFRCYRATSCRTDNRNSTVCARLFRGGDDIRLRSRTHSRRMLRKSGQICFFPRFRLHDASRRRFRIKSGNRGVTVTAQKAKGVQRYGIYNVR